MPLGGRLLLLLLMACQFAANRAIGAAQLSLLQLRHAPPDKLPQKTHLPLLLESLNCHAQPVTRRRHLEKQLRNRES